MATVNVTTFAEFSQAVTVSGDTVVCPQGAVWDMNEIAPEGTTIPRILCARVEGNGTSIRNLRTSSPIETFSAEQQVIDALHIENFVFDGTSSYFLFPGVSSAYVSFNHLFSRCKFSGIFPATCNKFAESENAYSHPYFSSCSFALSFSTTGTIVIAPRGGIYCRAKIQAPNAANVNTGLTWSRIDVDCPAATTLYVNGANANVYDGDLPLVTGISGTHGASYTSIFDKDTIANLQDSSMLQGVTRAQMLDASYLASIGFPIGVEQ